MQRRNLRAIVVPSHLHEAVLAGRGPDVLALLLASALPLPLPRPRPLGVGLRDPAAVRLLIEQLDKKGLSPLHHAAMRRDPHAVRWLLETWPAAAEQVTGGAFSHMPGCLALHLLARGPGTEPKRLRLPVSSEDATVACGLLLAAAPHTITARVPSPGGRGQVGLSGRLPLHLAASFGAPPPL